MVRWPVHTIVRFATDRFTPDGAPRGTVGSIVEVHATAYKIEVVDDAGRTTFLGAVPDADLERADAPDASSY